MRNLVVLTLALASAAMAQSSAPFTVKTVQPDFTQTTGTGGTLAYLADAIGVSSDATANLYYKPDVSTYAARITNVEVTGSPDFSLVSQVNYGSSQPTLTATASSLSFGLRYKPSSSKAVTGKLTVYYSEVDNALSPAFSTPYSGSFTLNLTGSCPEFALSYTVQPNGNSTLLSGGASIQLPATNLAETASVAITIANKGSGKGTVSAISIKGSGNFELAGVPYPPSTVEAGKTASFSVRYTPDVLEALSAVVRIDLASGSSTTFTVTGSGLGAQYAYELLSDSRYVGLEVNNTVALPDAVVNGDKTYATIRVTNTGNADGKITAISAAGTGFAVSESPFLPYTFVAGTSVTVVVSFAPTQPGKLTGRLRIGSDNFNLEGTGLGSNLTFSYVAGSGIVSLASAGTVVFTPTAVGDSSTVQVTVKNDGTASTQVNSISVSGTGTTFAASKLPTLPAKLEAGGSLTFSVAFTPVTVGSNTGTLKIDTNTFALSAASNSPAALPGYTFQGTTGTVEPQQQPAVGLTLNSAYPLALSGTLTLNFTSDVYANDPAVQFSSGSRSIAFTVPANSKQAVFANGAAQIRVQTGTVAGTITLVPTFATTAGGIDLTPTVPTTATLTVAQAAPKLLSLVLSSKATSTFTLLVTGYATNRSITQMDFTFTPTSGENVGTSKISLSVEPTFTAWYQGSTSPQYGSLFTASVTFTLAGDVKNVSSVADTIQTVSATLTNRLGVSSSQSVAIK